MMNTTRNTQYGYTLVELMVTVGIIGVLVAIAVPMYNNYTETATVGTARANANQLAMFEDNYFYENATFLAGTYDPGGDVTTLPNGLDWEPAGDNDLFKYVVAAGTCGDISQCYKITVTYKSNTSLTAVVEK
jgi:prepilin-type N-terminal cleavage/methylation domain-containing protein